VFPSSWLGPFQLDGNSTSDSLDAAPDRTGPLAGDDDRFAIAIRRISRRRLFGGRSICWVCAPTQKALVGRVQSPKRSPRCALQTHCSVIADQFTAKKLRGQWLLFLEEVSAGSELALDRPRWGGNRLLWERSWALFASSTDLECFTLHETANVTNVVNGQETPTSCSSSPPSSGKLKGHPALSLNVPSFASFLMSLPGVG
jgi:hypothetical protein